MNEDKRRKPYNIWIVVLGITILLMIGGFGSSVMYNSIKADADVLDYTVTFGKDYFGGDMNFDNFLSDLMPICKEDTNCSLENVEIKLKGVYCTKGDLWEVCSYEGITPLTEIEQPVVEFHKVKNLGLKFVKTFSLIWGFVILVIGLFISWEYMDNQLWGKSDFKKKGKK